MSVYHFNQDIGIKILEYSILSNRFFKRTTQELKIRQEGLVEGYLFCVKQKIRNLHVELQNAMAIVKGECDNIKSLELAVLLIGNIKGIKTVDCQLICENIIAPQFYEIQQGDTLSTIAANKLNNALLIDVLLDANYPLLMDATEVIPGYIIRIPHPKN